MSAPSQSPTQRRRRLIAGGGALVSAAVIAILAVTLAGGGQPSPPAPAPKSSAPSSAARAPKGPPPRATFKVHLFPSVSGARHPGHGKHLSARAQAKRERHLRAKTRRSARIAARKVRSTIAKLYTAAFLDVHPPASRWLSRFTDGARRQAWTRRRVVTIGRKGKRLKGLHEQQGTLHVQVLFDRRRRPFTAYAVAYFRGSGRIRGGGRLVVQSKGRFFLRRAKHGWAIYGFDVLRKDRTKGT